MKKEFTTPEMEMITFEVADVITTSNIGDGADED